MIIDNPIPWSRYIKERDELIEHIHHTLESDNQVTAAWLGLYSNDTFDYEAAEIQISVVVNNELFQAIEADRDIRKDLLRKLGRVLAFNDCVNPKFGGCRTRLGALYVADIAPHYAEIIWMPQSHAQIPTQNTRLLFDHVGLPQSGSAKLGACFQSAERNSRSGSGTVRGRCLDVAYD